MSAALRVLVCDESGGALVEYALVLALVSMVALTALETFGSILQTFFGTTSENLAQVAQQAK